MLHLLSGWELGSAVKNSDINLENENILLEFDIYDLPYLENLESLELNAIKFGKFDFQSGDVTEFPKCLSNLSNLKKLIISKSNITKI